MWINNASSVIADSIFRNNAASGLYASGSGTPTITDNTFTDNGQYAVYLNQSNISPLCDNNGGSGNGLDGVAVGGNVAADQTWSFGSDGFPIVVVNAVTVADGVTLTIPAGAVVKFDTAEQLTVYGTLQAIGSSVEWIVFTSLKDDDYGGDTNADGSITAPSAGDWRGIFLSGTSTNDGIGNFDYCRVRYGGCATEGIRSEVRMPTYAFTIPIRALLPTPSASSASSGGCHLIMPPRFYRMPRSATTPRMEFISIKVPPGSLIPSSGATPTRYLQAGPNRRWLRIPILKGDIRVTPTSMSIRCLSTLPAVITAYFIVHRLLMPVTLQNGWPPIIYPVRQY
jgi:parallel beta-helix repeat protein